MHVSLGSRDGRSDNFARQLGASQTRSSHKQRRGSWQDSQSKWTMHLLKRKSGPHAIIMSSTKLSDKPRCTTITLSIELKPLCTMSQDAQQWVTAREVL